MSPEVRKMKPRKAIDAREHRLRSIAVVMTLSLVLVVGIVLAIGSNRSKKSGTTAQTSAPASQPASSAPAASASAIESVQVPPLSVYRRRNIFRPLVAVQETTTTGTPGAGAGGVITLPPELDPTGRQVGSVVATALSLEGVFEQNGKLLARIRIGDALFEKVAVGEVFGGNYKLLSLGKDSSATVLYGDERFTIFAGQSLYW